MSDDGHVMIVPERCPFCGGENIELIGTCSAKDSQDEYVEIDEYACGDCAQWFWV